MRNGRGGGELSKHSPCWMGNEYKEPLSHESRNSGRDNWNAGKFIIWISNWKKKILFKQIISGLIPGKELPARFRVIAFLPEETLLWFIYDKYDTALLAMRWDSHFLYRRVIRTLMYFPQKHENISFSPHNAILGKGNSPEFSCSKGDNQTENGNVSCHQLCSSSLKE